MKNTALCILPMIVPALTAYAGDDSDNQAPEWKAGYEARCCAWKPTLEERIVGKVHELCGRLDTATNK